MSPVSRKVCPASLRKTPPEKLVVMAAVVESEMPMSAKKMPYHRRSGANHRAPVMVISGVIDTATRKQNSPPVPRMLASTRVSESFSFSDSHPRMTKIHGTNAGRRRKNSAIVRRLNRGKVVDGWAIQASMDLLLACDSTYPSSSYSG